MDATEKQKEFVRSLVKQLDRKNSTAPRFLEIKELQKSANFYNTLQSEDASSMIEDLLDLRK